MAQATVAAARGFGETTRRDAWWSAPLVVFLGLSTFIVYSTWAAFQGEHYTFGPYLSPFYSPELFGDSPHAWFGPQPGWWPAWLPFSPALLILPIPGLFRFTCYYYRGAYYKAFWADPPACAVGEPRKSYCGEHSFPLILQNVHRYFLFLAFVVLVILALRRLEGAAGSPIRRPAASRSASASARSCWRSTSSCSAATRSAATRCATSSAAAATSCRRAPLRQQRVRAASAASTAGTCSGPGAACSRSASPTSTSGSARWASGPT